MQSRDDEFNKAKLIQWIDGRLNAQEQVEVDAVLKQEKPLKDNSLESMAKKQKVSKKEKKQSAKVFVDYSGFEVFGDCGLK